MKSYLAPARPHLPATDDCADNAAGRIRPERAPVEEQSGEWNLSQWERLEFFVYRSQFNDITDEEEKQLLIDWLLQKRRDERDELLQAGVQKSDLEPTPLGGGYWPPKSQPANASDDEAA